MTDGIPIISYGCFHDVPRIFLIRHRGKLLLFESRFSKETDDYETLFRVYLMPEITREEIKQSGHCLSSLSERLIGCLPFKQIKFDETLREFVSEHSLRSLALE